MQFNFSDIWWLVLVLAVPAVTALYALYYRGRIALERLRAFADAHLLPHLLKNKTGVQQSIARPLILWSTIWVCGALAMAGPRWNYTDIETGIPNRSLVILLDLSKSMDVQDVKPSRLGRAKEEIGDIIDASHASNIGLIAFAAIPHMVAPLTDDMATIRYLMPSLDTSLVGMQGSRLAPALEMAGLMLRAAPGKDKSILIVSDGGMVDLAEAAHTVPQGVHVYAMGVGMSEGAPIPREGGGWIERRDGSVVIATLEADKLKAVADAGKGIYVTADYTDNDTHALLSHIETGPDLGTTKKGRTVRVWDEKFYIPVLIMALIMLPWFRRGYVFPVVMLLIFWPAPARADFGDLFLNKAQQARAAYDQRDYESAAQRFDTPYRRGVSQYRAGQFDKAEQSFTQDSDPKTMIDSEYNRGNAQLMQGKTDEAIASYEEVLKQRPEDQAAAKNLEIAKKLREQQQKKDDQKQDQKQDQKKDQQKDAKNDQKKDQKQDKKLDQKQQQDKQQQQQAQNDQQQKDKSGDQQKDKQGQQQQKGQSGEQQQKKQGEQQQNGQQQKAENGQPQDKQNQDQQQSQQSQNGQQGKEDQAQTGQDQKNQQQQGSQDKDKQQQANNEKGDQKGQQHNEQQQGEPDEGKGQQQAQNGPEKDKNSSSQDQNGKSDQKNAKNDQQYPPQPGSSEDKKNQNEQHGNSAKQAEEQKDGGDKDKEQTAHQGKQDDQKQAQNQSQQQAQPEPEQGQKPPEQAAQQPQGNGDDKQQTAQQGKQDDRKQTQNQSQQQAQSEPGQGEKQPEQAAQQAQGNYKQKQQQQQQAQAAGQRDGKEQTDKQEPPSYAQGHQDGSTPPQQQQQAYDSGLPYDGQGANERPGQVMNGKFRPRSQKDVDADQWLNRAVSDPGPFLKNQFSIDARRNPQPPEEDPW